jgi:hypothetical protein
LEKHISFGAIIAGPTFLFLIMPIWLGWADVPPSRSEAIREISINPTLSDGSSDGFATNQQIAVSGGNVYVVWSETVNTINSTANSTSKSFDIFFRRSTDGGHTFGDIVNVSNNNNNSRESNLAQISVSGDNVYVVWEAKMLQNNDIFFRRSTDGGHTFGDIVNVSNNSGSSSNPQIVALPSVVTKEVEVINNSSSINNNNNYSESNNEVYVLWTDDSDNDDIIGNQQILLRRSTDGGHTFGDIVNVSNNNGDNSYISSLNPRLAVMVPNRIGNEHTINENENNRTSNSNNHYLFILWTSCSTISDEPKCNVLFRRSTDGGHTFGDIVNVSNNSSSRDSNLAQISVSGDKVYQYN